MLSKHQTGPECDVLTHLKTVGSVCFEVHCWAQHRAAKYQPLTAHRTDAKGRLPPSKPHSFHWPHTALTGEVTSCSREEELHLPNATRSRVKRHLSDVPVKPDSLPSLSSSFYFHPWVSYNINFNIFTLLVLSLFLIFSQPCHTAFRIFFLQWRMEPVLLATEAQSLHHWTSREAPTSTSPSCIRKAEYGLFVCLQL